MIMAKRISLVVFLGLPGAGKSTLCKELFQSVENKANSNTINLIHVCFDELIPLSLQEKFVLMKQSKLEDENEGESWKSTRHDVYNKVDRLVECLRNNTTDLDILELFGIVEKQDANVDYVILLDDNFYYRSMRYEYFQLARKHNIGFCQCYLQCTTEIAIHQNLSRDIQVPTAAIETMAKNLQPPQPQELTWEFNTVVISLKSPDRTDAIWDIIEKSLELPVQPLVNRDLEIAEARLRCSLSVAHQADLILRSLVGTLIKEAKANKDFPTTKLPEFSRKVNSGRQSIIVAIREGSLRFPSHLAEEVCEEKKQELCEFLRSEMEKKLRDQSPNCCE